jgi:hypothetical protein
MLSYPLKLDLDTDSKMVKHVYIPQKFKKQIQLLFYFFCDQIYEFYKFNNNNNNNNNNNVYFKSLSYTNVLFKLEMNAQQNKIF